MKVLVIHTSYQYKGGEDTVVAEEIKLLQLQGIMVELLEFNNHKNAFLKLLQLPFNLQSYFKTKEALALFKPDIVHIHNLHFGGSPSVIYAIKRSKIPFVITLHNYRLLCPSGILFHNGKLFLDSLSNKFPWKAVGSGVYKNSKLITFWLSLSIYLHNKLGTWKICNRYIVLSEHAKKLFLSSNLGLSASQFVVKPNFCSDPILKNQQAQDYFLYVGRLSEEKGIMLLLSVFSSCPYKVKIAGDGPLKDEVVKYSSRFPNIEFLGILNKTEVFTILESCSALVFPSIWFEGMPLTIIEAFACGIPVISSRIGAMETMITPDYNGLHFEVQSKEGFRKKLDDWHNLSEVQKQEYRLNARKTYENYYTPDKNAQQLLAIYNDVMNEEKLLLAETL
ncbi:glycosyltransferase family 4 protein [Mucilaginibacter arboris]|uniref:Glycosyltransferase n=1 Tax=Mucilaginibacter arboris TaxID=2682090 RepID=A0A7K1T1I8_9SPHI|nr:glycosyltransferase family 4 protein [Mucilaginibacter arboris]MVN23452.1 glycosyltransferase [Mucilaginibacter arboris]